MTELKSKMIISAASLFIPVVTTVTTVKPMCMGWFYRPEVPEILKGPIKKKKGVV
ncbi:MAG TPA: cyclic lactone autoinducer peptide [Thermoanaerobacterales bacterium]|nr:cyclic lactone autoinducer peptide [Thermoanaerobacterales bacterium]